MMKKVIAWLLLLVMVLSLTACGKSGSKADDKAGNGSEVSSDAGGKSDKKDKPSKKDDGYKAAVELLADVQYLGSTDKLEQLAPEAFWTFYESNGMPRSSMLAEAEYAVGDTNYWMKEMYGADFTLSTEITQADEVSDDELSKIAAAFAEQKGIDASWVKAAYTLSVTVTLKGTTTGQEALIVPVVKIQDTWYCADWSIWDEGSYVAFAVEMMVSG